MYRNAGNEVFGSQNNPGGRTLGLGDMEKINIFDESISIEKIRNSLAEIEPSILEDKTTGHFYKVPSRIGKEARMIYRAMDVQNPEGPSRYTLKQKM